MEDHNEINNYFSCSLSLDSAFLFLEHSKIGVVTQDNT